MIRSLELCPAICYYSESEIFLKGKKEQLMKYSRWQIFSFCPIMEKEKDVK